MTDERITRLESKVDDLTRKTSSIYDNLPGIGLYAMVFFTLINSCDVGSIDTNVKKIQQKQDVIEKKIDYMSRELDSYTRE
jgi:tetrahydromethanopterin S-methyltransferase subunit B